MKVLILNGPNLNMIGKRDTNFYGVQPFEEILEELREAFPDWEIGYFQSNGEGAIIDRMQELELGDEEALIINGGAYSHYSIAILDALKVLQIPKVEVHFSNIYAREEFRHRSVLSAACNGVIAGFGKQSYRLALEWLRMMERPRIGF